MIDLAGLGDVYIGRVGYESHGVVRDYVLGELKPELINLHGPCAYLRDDPRFSRDYQQVASGAWGDNYARKALELDGIDERCAPRGPAYVKALARDGKLVDVLVQASAAGARDLWLCARNHLPSRALPDVSDLAGRLAASGLRETNPARAKALLDAAVTLDPNLTAAARRLLELRLGPARPPSRR